MGKRRANFKVQGGDYLNVCLPSFCFSFIVFKITVIIMLALFDKQSDSVARIVEKSLPSLRLSNVHLGQDYLVAGCIPSCLLICHLKKSHLSRVNPGGVL